MKTIKEIIEEGGGIEALLSPKNLDNSRKSAARRHFERYLEDAEDLDALYYALKYAMRAHNDSWKGKQIADILRI